MQIIKILFFINTDNYNNNHIKYNKIKTNSIYNSILIDLHIIYLLDKYKYYYIIHLYFHYHLQNLY